MQTTDTKYIKYMNYVDQRNTSILKMFGWGVATMLSFKTGISATCASSIFPLFLMKAARTNQSIYVISNFVTPIVVGSGFTYLTYRTGKNTICQFDQASYFNNEAKKVMNDN
jgi:hypothetical protein